MAPNKDKDRGPSNFMSNLQIKKKKKAGFWKWYFQCRAREKWLKMREKYKNRGIYLLNKSLDLFKAKNSTE